MSDELEQVEQEAAIEEPQDEAVAEEKTTAEIVQEAFADDDTPVEQEPVAEEGDDGTDAVEATDDTIVPAWKEALTEAGYNDFDDPDTAIPSIIQSHQDTQKQIEELARQVRYYQDQAKYGNSSPAPAPAPAENETQQESDPLDAVLDGWEDPRWAQQFIEVNPETGARTLREDIDEDTAEKVRAADRKVREWSDLLQDPRRFAEAIDARLDRRIAEQVGSTWDTRQKEQTEKQFVDNFMEENSSWLYDRDPATGKYKRDPLSDQVIFSADGNRFLQHMQAVAEDGITDVTKQIKYAQLAMGKRDVAGQPTPEARQESVQETVQKRKAEMRGQRRAKPNTQREFNGVSPESAQAPTGVESMSFGEETLAAMRLGE